MHSDTYVHIMALTRLYTLALHSQTHLPPSLYNDVFITCASSREVVACLHETTYLHAYTLLHQHPVYTFATWWFHVNANHFLLCKLCTMPLQENIARSTLSCLLFLIPLLLLVVLPLLSNMLIDEPFKLHKTQWGWLCGAHACLYVYGVMYIFGVRTRTRGCVHVHVQVCMGRGTCWGLYVLCVHCIYNDLLYFL